MPEGEATGDPDPCPGMPSSAVLGHNSHRPIHSLKHTVPWLWSSQSRASTTTSPVKSASPQGEPAGSSAQQPLGSQAPLRPPQNVSQGPFRGLLPPRCFTAGRASAPSLLLLKNIALRGHATHSSAVMNNVAMDIHGPVSV